MADSASALDQAFARDAENPAVCVADGFGVRVTTRAGRLVVADGIGRHRRQRTYNRATHGLARLVVTGTSGHVSIDALRWLDGAGVGLVVLDPSSGEVIVASTRVANDDARLRRAQALAAGTETGLAIARYLVELKLAGEAALADQGLGDPTAADRIRRTAAAISNTASLDECRQLEAAAANVYWQAWESVGIEFVSKDESRVPDNWRVFEGRRSAINPGTSRHATDPANAILNYLYRLLEAEGHLATIAVGLDPGLGVLHADMKGRASFVLDLVEAVRPIAERHVLRLLAAQPLRWRDFHEDQRGVVRVLPPLSHRLAEAMPGFASSVAPVTERIVRMLATASPYDPSMPSVLTREKHRAAARRRLDGSTADRLTAGPGQVGVPPRGKRRQKPPMELEPGLPLPICRGCGVALPPEGDRRRRRGGYCSGCLAARRQELGAALPVKAGRRAAEFEALTGVSPAHTTDAQTQRSRANAAQRAAQTAWQEPAGSRPDSEWFRTEVLPGLAGISLTTIARSTGISTSAASKIRAGRLTPHPRHWLVLKQLSGTAK